VVATGLLPRTDQPRTGGQPELDGVAAHASCA
jgi:hypothetical protein